jgi:CMP-N,N'-diacetyllegionaminic acid synthase
MGKSKALSIVGIIPARGGSKGIPRKNLRNIAGKPLIAYTIEAARGAKLLTKVTVSTDDKEIAATAKSHGAEVPILRPSELAQDSSPTIHAIQHMVRHIEDQGGKVDVAVTLQPTSPLREAVDIDVAVKILLDTGADSVISVTAAKYSPYLMFTLNGDRLVPFFGEEAKIRRQDLPKVYSLNGAIYVTRRDTLMKGNSLYGKDVRAYVMPEERSLDVDTLLDLRIIDLLLRGIERERS